MSFLHKIVAKSILPWLALVVVTGELHAQGLIIGRQDGRTGDECRISDAELVPIISLQNPFFSDHDWDDTKKVETARMSSARFVSIAQKGCLRHHKKFLLSVTPAVCKPEDLSFYAIEVFNLFNRVYYNDPDFWHIKKQFESEMLRKLPVYGLGNQFDFQIAEFTFICEFTYQPKEGALIKVEEVRLLHEHKVRMPGVAEHEDDGWFVAPKF